MSLPAGTEQPACGPAGAHWSQFIIPGHRCALNTSLQPASPSASRQLLLTSSHLPHPPYPSFYLTAHGFNLHLFRKLKLPVRCMSTFPTPSGKPFLTPPWSLKDGTMILYAPTPLCISEHWALPSSCASAIPASCHSFTRQMCSRNFRI